MSEPTQPSEETIKADRREADAEHKAGRGPTAEEAAAAEVQEVSPETRAAEEEMNELGANVKGEGQIEG